MFFFPSRKENRQKYRPYKKKRCSYLRYTEYLRKIDMILLSNNFIKFPSDEFKF